MIQHAVVSGRYGVLEREEAKYVESILQDDHDHIFFHDVSRVVDLCATKDERTSVNPNEYRSPKMI